MRQLDRGSSTRDGNCNCVDSLADCWRRTRASGSAVPGRRTRTGAASSTGCSAPSAASTTPALNLAIALRQRAAAAGPGRLRSDGRLSRCPAEALPIPGRGPARRREPICKRRGVPLGGPARPARRGRPGGRRTSARRARRRRREPGANRPSRGAAPWPRHLTVPFYLVDADVVVPTSLFPREEYAARTIRPKIHRVWDEYLKPLPNPSARVDWSGPRPAGEADRPRGALEPGSRSAESPRSPAIAGAPARPCAGCGGSCASGCRRYATERNEPTPYVTSELSAHLHFGQISPLTIALAVAEQRRPAGVHRRLPGRADRPPRAGDQLRGAQSRLRPLAGCPEWGAQDPGRARRRPAAGPLLGSAARGRRDARPALERRAEGDGR